ncbi:hypothetical protein [Aquimarina longa]|uniref:hypothetical protein n=1 Tax=Aquimarina longa TaxID=1080221 RepID=UPI0007857481|nr:hypothetical protein [Aquimarina longa]
MKTSTTQEKERRIRLFEERVFTQLQIKQSQFNCCVESYSGYALLLRRWIQESNKQGLNSYEIATIIRKSPLAIDHIQQNKPLSLKKVIPKNSRVSVS